MIGRLALNQIQKFVYDTLVAAQSGWSVSSEIFDEVPDGENFPYIELGTTTDSVEGSKGAKWSENVQQISVWSDANGSKECNDIMNQVIDAMMSLSMPQALTDNFRVDTLDRGLVELVKLEGPSERVFRQGVIRFSMRVEDTS
tara:strand:+ start:245 stop:673 length:429 start_codon:yes stop_codon:yes gene_type:complete